MTAIAAALAAAVGAAAPGAMPPLPVPPVEHIDVLPVAPRAQEAALLADQVRALGPMPADSDPAGQAAWRIRRYDLEIQADRRTADREARAAAMERARLDHLKGGDPNNPSRLQALRALDYGSSLESLSELHAKAAGDAKAAIVEAERVRRAVAAGLRPAADLAAARARSAQAQKLAQAAQQARADKILAHALVSAREADAQFAAMPEAERSTAGLRLGDMLAAQERARLESHAYAEVRDAVEAGKRPPADLEAARQALKAAQVVVYDQLDALTKGNLALLEKLRRESERRIADEEARVAAEEKALPTLSAEDRPRAEDRLRMHREILEGYRRSAALAERMPPRLPQRPQLPILPPRS